MGLKQDQQYHGFEQGSIRPPSEARSLLIRVTRNCPWNKCSFCSVYKGEAFSLRPTKDIIRDIDSIHEAITIIRSDIEKYTGMSNGRIETETGQLPGNDRIIFHSALDWVINGDGAVFLQDANSLIVKPDQLIRVLEHLRFRFPWISRITSYARSRTINRINEPNLKQLARAGLNRIHIGMESGSDKVLIRIKKGVTKQDHIDAGRRVKNAGIELSEYVMPGIGGSDLSMEHALETADALNRINADFIRLRSLSIMPGTPLYNQYRAGDFIKKTELETVAEIRMFIGHLEGITSTIKSDHVYNLLQEIDGTLPQDRQKMLQSLDNFLGLPQNDQVLFQLGRRMGYFHRLNDLQSTARRTYVDQIRNKFDITPENIDRLIEQNTPKYI